jgi:hypothetical protein
MIRSQSWFAICCLVICVVAAGCGSGGPELGTVTGTVTMDGEPLDGVLVTFVPVEGGRAATATTDASGKYELIYASEKGAVVGQHRVSVTTLNTAAPAVDMSEVRSDDPRYEELLAQSKKAYNNASTKEAIPARYNTETELVKEVASGSNEINLELTSGG